MSPVTMDLDFAQSNYHASGPGLKLDDEVRPLALLSSSFWHQHLKFLIW